MRCLGLAGGLATLCLCWSADLPYLLCLVGRGPRNIYIYVTYRGHTNALRAREGSRCGVYLLSSGLGAAVPLLTNCKGTTVPYFL